jgi:cell division septal protein FtsQ
MMRLLLLGLPLFFATLSAISWGVKKVKTSPLFKVHEVLVEGDLEMNCAELIGMNILDINSQGLKERYESERVRLVGLRKKFPGRLVVEVEERRPYAILELKDTYEIDREGYVLRQIKGKRPRGGVGDDQIPQPVVRVLTTKDRTEVWELYTKQLMEVLRRFEKDFGQVDETRLYDDDLVVKTNRKEIHLGSDQWVQRLDKLTNLDWRQLDARDIDLRFRSQIVVKR